MHIPNEGDGEHRLSQSGRHFFVRVGILQIWELYRFDDRVRLKWTRSLDRESNHAVKTIIKILKVNYGIHDLQGITRAEPRISKYVIVSLCFNFEVIIYYMKRRRALKGMNERKGRNRPAFHLVFFAPIIYLNLEKISITDTSQSIFYLLTSQDRQDCLSSFWPVMRLATNVSYRQ